MVNVHESHSDRSRARRGDRRRGSLPALDDATFAAIERAYNEYGVIFFRGQSITPAQQVAFTRRFGEIEFNIFGERWSVPGNPGDRRPVQHHGRRPSRPAFAAPARTGTATCATRRDHRAGPSCTPSRSPSCTGSRWGTPSSPAPPRPGMPCRTRCSAPSRAGEAVFDFRGRKRSFPPTQAEIDRNPPVRHPLVRHHPRPVASAST